MFSFLLNRYNYFISTFCGTFQIAHFLKINSFCFTSLAPSPCSLSYFPLQKHAFVYCLLPIELLPWPEILFCPSLPGRISLPLRYTRAPRRKPEESLKRRCRSPFEGMPGLLSVFPKQRNWSFSEYVLINFYYVSSQF